MMALLSFVLFLAAPDTGRKLDTVAAPCTCVQLVGDSTPAARQAFPVSLSIHSAHTGQPRDGFGARGTGWNLYKIYSLMVALQPRACPTMKPTARDETSRATDTGSGCVSWYDGDLSAMS